MEHGFKRVSVIGAGQMGHGIAQVCAQKGFEVMLYDISEPALNKGMDKIRHWTRRMVARGELSEAERRQLLERITPTIDMEPLVGEAHIVVETAEEKTQVKFEIFRELDERCREDAVLVTDTSSISITHIAGHTNRPEMVMGMHFMNPVPKMKLVELIRGLRTSDETYERVRAFAIALDKETVTAEDYPGFIVNRILLPMVNEACYALMERVGTAEEIDRAMQLGANHPMGPLALADYIGLDVCLSILEVLHDGLGDAKYQPCPLLQRYVRAGYLGRKTGHGFYIYPSD